MGEPRRTCLRSGALATVIVGGAALGALGGLGGCGDDGERPLDVDAGVDAPAVDAPPVDGPDAATGAAVLELDETMYTIGPDPVLVSNDTGQALMTLRNTGTGPATGLAYAVTPDTDEMRVLDNCGTSLQPGAACTVVAQLDPSRAGMKMFTVTVTATEGASDSALVSAVAGSRFRITINAIAVGATMTDGRVQSAPAGIDCGMGMTDCEFIFTDPGPVTLTATDDGAGTLVDWSIGGCEVTGPCVASLTRNYTATIAFHAPFMVVSGSAAGTSDEAHGVALDADNSIVLVGSRGTSALVARHDGAEGAPLFETTFGTAPRRSLGVSVGPDRTVATAGEENGDAVMSSLPVDLMTEPVKHVITGAGADRGNAVHHDDMNRVYMVGDAGANMSWGRWPAGMATPDWLLDTTTPQGTALGAAWTTDTLWVAGALSDQTGWLGKVDAATGALVTPTPVTGTMLVSAVAPIGDMGDLVVAGWTTGSLVVRRYDSTLTEVWTRTFPSADDIHPDLAVDAPSGAIYIAYDGASGCVLRKLAADGAPILVRGVPGTHCQDVAVNVDGAVVVGWATAGADHKYFVAKYFH